MADDIDRASDQELFHNLILEKNIVDKPEPKYGPSHCEECGVEMPELRRQYGFKLCVSCQTEAERQDKLFKR